MRGREDFPDRPAVLAREVDELFARIPADQHIPQTPPHDILHGFGQVIERWRIDEVTARMLEMMSQSQLKVANGS